MKRIIFTMMIVMTFYLQGMEVERRQARSSSANSVQDLGVDGLIGAHFLMKMLRKKVTQEELLSGDLSTQRYEQSSEEKKYLGTSCRKCGRDCFYISNRFIHEKKYHPELFPFKCEECNTPFSELRLLEYHQHRARRGEVKNCKLQRMVNAIGQTRKYDTNEEDVVIQHDEDAVEFNVPAKRRKIS